MGEGETRCRLIAFSSRKAPRGPPTLTFLSYGRIAINSTICLLNIRIYCGRVWNLIQACDVQSSDYKVYTQLHKWLPEVNKQKFTPPATSRVSDRRGSGRGRVCSLMKIICGGSAEYYVNQKACYTGLHNISSTVLHFTHNTVSKRAVCRPHWCERGGGVNIVYVYFGKPFMKVRVP